MINTDDLFTEIRSNLAFHIAPGLDTNDLARTAEAVVDQGFKAVSVPPDAVRFLWTWLEKEPIRILARFDLREPVNKNLSQEQLISDLSKQVNMVFKQGATGAQIFLRFSDLPAFIADIQAIRDDLFFNKDLSIGIDIDEIGPFDGRDIFAGLKKIKATALFLGTAGDQADADFIGRVYGLLGQWDNSFTGELHFGLNNDLSRMEGAWRLIQKMQPEIAKKVKFFIQA